MTNWKIGLIILVLLLGASIYFFSNNSGSDKPYQTPNQISMENQESATNNSVKVFVIKATQWKFEPSIIKVKQGERVRIVLESLDVAHGLAIPQFGVNIYSDPSSPGVAEFVADKKGSFVFACSVYCGEGHSDMKGMLVVE